MVFAAASSVDAVSAVLAIITIAAAGVGGRLFATVKVMKDANDELRNEVHDLRDHRAADRKECDGQLAELRGEVEVLKSLVVSDIARQVAAQVREIVKESS